MSKGELAKIDWAPASQQDANECFKIYHEYVDKRKTVTQLAIECLETDKLIKNRIKWACMALKDEKGDNAMVKQMADTAIIDQVKKLDALVDEYEATKATNRERALLNAAHENDENYTPLSMIPLPALRDYTGILRERRLTLMDLFRVRGVLDFNDGKPGQGSVNIIMPSGLNRGQGVETLKDKPVYEVSRETVEGSIG